MRSGRSPLPARDQIDTGPHVDQRVVTGLDTLDPGYRVVNHGTLFLVVVIDDGFQFDRAEFDDLALLGPPHRRVVGGVVRVRDLGGQGETGPSVDDSSLDLVVQESRVLGFGFFVGQVGRTGVRSDAVPHERGPTVGRQKFEGVDPEIVFRGEAGRGGLGSFDESLGRRGLAQKLLDGGRGRGSSGGGGSPYGFEQFQKPLAGPDGEKRGSSA